MNGFQWAEYRSSTPAREPQGEPNDHHSLSLMFTITYFCIRPGLTDEKMSILHVVFI
jgi:hypothetical protein